MATRLSNTTKSVGIGGQGGSAAAIADGAMIFHHMIGRCEAMRRVFGHVERAAAADTTVLIRGESGTGKELVAQAIHDNSGRREGPFVALNVAAIPATLVESEIFGHTQGAFTGADKDRVGRFEAAHKGTLFVDEIGDVELSSQAKLLRVLEDRLITPVGSNEPKEVDVRVIFATNRNLEQMVAEATFREDLYYRINVVAISLPPLRERPGDIACLTDHILEKVCAANGKPRATLDPDLAHFLATYDWPGNVRQLQSCLESMVLFSESATLTMDDLPEGMPGISQRTDSWSGVCQEGTIDEIVKEVVLRRLRHYGGCRAATAQSLGLSVRTLQRHLKSWETSPGFSVIT